MNKYIFFLLFFLCFSLHALCQANSMEAEMHMQGNSLSNEFQPYEICADFKYNILKRLYVKCEFEHTIALFNINGNKDYYTNNMLGAKIGYTFLSISDLSMSAACGIGDNLQKNNNWKYSYYDAGIYAYIGHYIIRPCIGVLLRKYDSHNSNFHDYTRLLMSLGVNIKI